MVRAITGKAALALSLALFGLGVTGCDIVQGFRNASDAIFPAESTYLDTPGFRLAAGAYRDLDFSTGKDIYLLARSPDPHDTSLYSMLYANPNPCAIPKVGRYWAGDGTYQNLALITYVEDDPTITSDDGASQGTVHFANADCHAYDFTVAKSSLPFIETPEGYVVVANGDLVMADPVMQKTRVIVPAIRGLLWNAFGDFNILQAGGHFGAFRYDWKPAGIFGTDVVAAGTAGQSFFFEDAAGIHQLTSSGGDTPKPVEKIIAADGCGLSVPNPLGAQVQWVVYYSPCADKQLIAFNETSSKTSKIDLGVAVAPANIAFMPAWPKGDGDPATDPFWTFYLGNFDGTTGLGTLMVRTPDKQDHPLGDHAGLDGLTILESSTETFGFAMVDLNGSTGRYLRWNADGSTKEVATHVLRNSGGPIVNYDDAPRSAGDTRVRLGDYSIPWNGGVSVLAKGVLPGSLYFQDGKGRWTAILHDLDASADPATTVGTLSITDGTLNPTQGLRSSGPLPTLRTLATGVPIGRRTRFLDNLLPGMAYLTRYDPITDTGRLEYRNEEIGFTATVGDGVADYLLTADGLIFSIPFGENAGIWLVRAR